MAEMKESLLVLRKVVELDQTWVEMLAVEWEYCLAALLDP